MHYFHCLPAIFALFVSAVPTQLLDENSKSQDVIQYSHMWLCEDDNGSYGDCTGLTQPAAEFGVSIAFNQASISGIASITVDSSGVACTFGSEILSYQPWIMCGGTLRTIQGGTAQVNLDDGESNGLSKNVVCFWCGFS